MQLAAANLDFEKAAMLRDQITEIQEANKVKNGEVSIIWLRLCFTYARSRQRTGNLIAYS